MAGVKSLGIVTLLRSVLADAEAQLGKFRNLVFSHKPKHLIQIFAGRKLVGT